MPTLTKPESRAARVWDPSRLWRIADYILFATCAVLILYAIVELASF